MTASRDCVTCGGIIRVWGCPDCGGKASTVKYVESDEDGNRLRVRVCSNCRTKWATEETPINIGAFYIRAQSKRDRKRAIRWWRCEACGGRYIIGRYYPHTKVAHHVKALTKRRMEAGSLVRTRERQRIWAAQKRTATRASSDA